MRIINRSFLLFAAALLLSGVGIKLAHAHVIDRIEINHVGDEAEIHVLFDVRIQYLSEASLNNGEIHVFLNLLEADPDRERLVPEAMDSPPTDIATHFTGASPGLASTLFVRFAKAVP